MRPLFEFAVYAVVVVHFALLGYLVTGGFLALRWRWTIALHVPFGAWAVLTSVVAIDCPVTLLENLLRVRAGLPPLEVPFIESYIVAAGETVGSLNLLRATTFGVILFSWALWVRRWWSVPLFRAVAADAVRATRIESPLRQT